MARELEQRTSDAELAAQVTQRLAEGKPLSTVTPTFRLGEGEVLYGSLDGAVHLYVGADVVTPGSAWVAFGSPAMMLGTLGASALFNRSRKKKAARAAAVQWREANRGTLHVTSQRLALQGVHGWLDLEYDYFHAAEVGDAGIVAHYADWPLTCITTSHPQWVYAILKESAFGHG